MMYYGFIFLSSYFVIILCQDGMLGPAELNIKNIEECPDKELYPNQVVVNKKKYNRTVDVINGILDITNFDEESKIGFSATVAKFGDGGYKPNFYNMEDSDLCEFLMLYYGDGFKGFLKQLGHPTTECPLILGSYTLKDYLMDYNQFPDKLLYGDFRIDAYMMQNNEKLNCIRVFITSEPKMSFGK